MPPSSVYSTINQARHHVTHDVIKEDALEDTEEAAASKGDDYGDNTPPGADTALVDDDHTFILATDADMAFYGEAVKELLELCDTDLRVGAACGRTHPIGKRTGPIVWHQVFEYAKGTHCSAQF